MTEIWGVFVGGHDMDVMQAMDFDRAEDDVGAQFFLPQGLTDDEDERDSSSSLDSSPLLGCLDRLEPTVSQLTSLYAGVPGIHNAGFGVVCTGVPENVSEAWRSSGGNWVSHAKAVYPGNWPTSRKAYGCTAQCGNDGARCHVHRVSRTRTKESIETVSKPRRADRGRNGSLAKARKERVPTAMQKQEDRHRRSQDGSKRGGSVRTDTQNTCNLPKRNKHVDEHSVKPTGSSQADTKRKESPKQKKRLEKSSPPMIKEDVGRPRSPRAGKHSESSRTTKQHRDVDNDATTEIIADAATRVEAHRQEWARKLESAAESFGNFGRGGNMHRGKGRSHGRKSQKIRSEKTESPAIAHRNKLDGLSISSGGRALPGCRAAVMWVAQILQLIIHTMSYLLRNVFSTVFTVVSWHLNTVASVFSDARVSICFSFLYFLPSVHNSVSAGAMPAWMTSCLWYVFLVQFFFYGGNGGLLGFAQVVLPFAFLAKCGHAENLLVQMNGGERLLLAYVLACVKTGNLNRSVTYVSAGLQLLLTFIIGNCTSLHWIFFVVSSATIYPAAKAKRRVLDFQSAMPSVVKCLFASLIEGMHRTC